MKRWKERASAFMFALTVGTAAMAETIAPGDYIRPGDTGSLKIERRSGQSWFSLTTSGTNGHGCDVSGRMVGDIAEYVGELSNEQEHPCRLRLTPSGDGTQIDVQTVTEDACRTFCGARAGLDGDFRRPPKTCTRLAQRETRNRFSALYRSKHYREASAELATMLEVCGEYIDWVETDRVRNDLALAYLHGGSPEHCLRTLAKTAAASDESEAALQERLPPYDYETYLPVARATWYNLRLCERQPGRR
ncbi:hypothetical protein OPU71_09095 [Niveibacterium sp. 24ML]|uniref:hypothetical protein n=1 Tax=Niveibacterium sp. 24ML TaxID=2985512 RepID=UPI0022702536|nr:hypothetical protein [Niveibacterium sp. 24ML]MCX9156274.1 hypothetical protein [Niveibacterium sp. 24ML]